MMNSTTIFPPSSHRVEALKLPLVCVTPFGTISIMLAHDVNVELSVDRSIRVVCWDKFAVSSNQKGTKSGVLHPFGHILQEEDKVFCYFTPQLNKTSNTTVASSYQQHPSSSSVAMAIDSNTKLLPNNNITALNELRSFGGSFFGDPNISKMAILGTQGVLFSMSHLKDAFLVSAAAALGTSSLSMDRIQFPPLRYDYTLQQFYTDAQMGTEHLYTCNNIVKRARYEEKQGMLFSLSINGFLVRQRQNGDVEIICRPRQLNCSPNNGTVYLRTATVEMEVQTDQKACVKCGSKRVHVSRSGMVVSDGNCTTSMDHIGRIVSAS